MGSSFLFAQQWTGANNTTSDISRGGKVSIGITTATEDLNIFNSIGIYADNGNTARSQFSTIKMYSRNSNGSYDIVNGWVTTPSTTQSPALFIGSVTNKTFVIHNNQIGIGTDAMFCSDCVDYRLFVKDGLRTEKIKVDIAANNGWADYVFEPDYNLMPLAEVEQFIKQNGHLPEVPTTEEAIANGIELKEMNILLLKKVEELTLYSIQQQKELEELKAQMSNLLNEEK